MSDASKIVSAIGALYGVLSIVALFLVLIYYKLGEILGELRRLLAKEVGA